VSVPAIAENLVTLPKRDNAKKYLDAKPANMVQHFPDALRLDMLKDIGAKHNVRRIGHVPLARDARIIVERLDISGKLRAKSGLAATIVKERLGVVVSDQLLGLDQPLPGRIAEDGILPVERFVQYPIHRGY
jgi:hypothetical protein